MFDTQDRLPQILASDIRVLAAFEGSSAPAAELRNLTSQLVARQEAIMLGDLKRAASLRNRSSGRPVKLDVPCETCRSELHLSNWVDPPHAND